MTTLANLVIVRIGGQRLIELTNDTSGAITIDDDVLGGACDDAEGKFALETGSTPDTTNKTHVAILTEGVIYFLENYKARDGGILTQHGKNFFAGCKSMREKQAPLALGNSVLLPSTTRANTRPDMDKNNPAFRGRQVNKLTFIAGEDDNG